MKVKTNNKPRPILTYSDMDLVQQAKLEKECGEDGLDIFDFIGFEYKGVFYRMEEFIRISPIEGDWNGAGPYGMLIKLINGDEGVVVGIQKGI